MSPVEANPFRTQPLEEDPRMKTRFLEALRGREAGASMTEYIIIVALVAIFLIGAVGLFGDKVKGLFSTSTGKLNQVQSKMNSR